MMNTAEYLGLVAEMEKVAGISDALRLPAFTWRGAAKLMGGSPMLKGKAGKGLAEQSAAAGRIGGEPPQLSGLVGDMPTDKTFKEALGFVQSYAKRSGKDLSNPRQFNAARRELMRDLQRSGRGDLAEHANEALRYMAWQRPALGKIEAMARKGHTGAGALQEQMQQRRDSLQALMPEAQPPGIVSAAKRWGPLAAMAGGAGGGAYLLARRDRQRGRG